MSELAARVRVPRNRSRVSHGAPRILTAVPICDGHDSAIITINLELARHGVEVVYLGYHRSVRDIVRAAIQEDVQAIGLSSYNGGHVAFFTDVLTRLRAAGAAHIRLFGGGGGTFTPQDAKLLKARGVDEIFFAGTPLHHIVQFVKTRYYRRSAPGPSNKRQPILDDLRLAQALSAAESHSAPSSRSQAALRPAPLTVGVTGPGGAGKTTLIDELTLRFLNARPKGRLAILSHDPTLAGRGALLGDRATMIYAQNDRVFMRSLGTRGKPGGLSASTRRCLDILQQATFDLVLVESAGIGQEDLPFQRDLVDKQIFVMSPDYGSRLQLQKIVMLETADIVVVNKSDLPMARTATAELEQRLRLNQQQPTLISTVAKRHADTGVNDLFAEVMR